MCSEAPFDSFSYEDPFPRVDRREETDDFEVVSRWVLDKMRLVAKSAGISFRGVEKEAICLFSLFEQRWVVTRLKPRRSPTKSR